MRTIAQTIDVTPFNVDKKNMRLFRVIGSTDVDGKGTQHPISDIDPFIFLDDAMIEGELTTSFTKHPHSGLTAVTYLLEGAAHAWDNIHGPTPNLNHAGGVYCIHSGRGVVHGEAPIEGVRKLRLLQLWINPGIYNLPLCKAHYQLFQPNELPIYEDETLWVKIIIGTGFGYPSPVQSSWPIQYLHIKLGSVDNSYSEARRPATCSRDPEILPNSQYNCTETYRNGSREQPRESIVGAGRRDLNCQQTLAGLENYSFQIPNKDWQGFIYIIDGMGEFGENKVIGKSQQCLVLGNEPSEVIRIKNLQHSPLEFILATGQPHHKPFVKLLGHGGAIVADTKKRAREFMRNYEADPENFGRES